MDNFLEIEVPFRSLARTLGEDFAEVVAEEAWRVYCQASEGSPELKKTLQAAIRNHIVVPGFRRGQAHRAPAVLLRPAVIETWRSSEDMARAVLGLWSEAKKKLLQQVRVFLQEAGLPAEGLAAPNLTGYWKWGEFQSHVDRFREAFPEAGSEDEVRLAIALLTERLPVPDEVYEKLAEILSGGKEMAQGFWTRILDEMRGLPPEAPEWDTLDDFIRAAREIGEEKLRERTFNLRRSALREAVEAFRASRSQWVEFFQMDRCGEWNVDACLPDQIEEALSLLQELEGLMAQYEALDGLRPSTVAERRDREHRLRELEERIQTLYASVNERLIVRREEGFPSEEVVAEELEEVPPVRGTAEIQGLEEAVPLEETILVEEVPAPEEPFAPVEAVLVREEMALPQEEVILPPAEEAPEEGAPVPEGLALPSELEVPSPAGEEAVLEVEVSPAVIETVEMRAAEPLPLSSAPEELEREANRLLVSLLSEGDVLTGYWLAWAMERQGMKSAIRSPLIKAVQGAFWTMRLWPDRPARIIHDLREISLHAPTGRHRLDQWMRASSALYLALVAPADGWGEWLEIQSDEIPDLAKLAETVRSFASLGWALKPEDIEGIRGREERESAIRRFAEEARRWLDVAKNRRTTYQRASAVWRWMTSPDGDLYKWFSLVGGDQRNLVEEVRRELENWRRENWVDDLIQEIDLQLIGRRLSPIEGTARRQVIRWVGEACDLAERWVQAVLSERQFAQQSEWLQDRFHALLKAFIDGLPVIEYQVGRALGRFSDREAERAALCLLRQSVVSLKRVFSLPGGAVPVGKFDPEPAVLRERSFEENLLYRLCWFPEASLVDLDESGEMGLREENAGRLLQTLLDSGLRDRPLEEVLSRWISIEDYRFVDALLSSALASEDPRRKILEAQSREALRSSISRLDLKRSETVNAVEQALIDGLISEAERSRYIGSIEAVRKEITRMEQQPEPGRWLLNCRALSERLEMVQEELNGKRRSRLEGQRKRWSTLRPDLLKVFSPDEIPSIERAVESGLEREELRVVDEYLANLEEALKGKKRPLEGLFVASRKRDRLREFREAIQPLTDLLSDPSRSLNAIARDILQGSPPAELNLPRLPAPRVREIGRALAAWSALKSNPLEADEADSKRVIPLMEYLGFRTQGRSPVSLVHRQPGLRHWRVSAIPGGTGQVPVPQFGSERNGQYDVIGIWDRPGFSLMSALVERTADRPAIVFYFGRLLRRQREDLLRSEELRSLKVPVLILDEILLLFLAREYDIRLDTFFACTLPFTTLNPYVPFAAGVVPPEMFVGRKDFIRQLIDPRGPAIVYGGRQLGKSALLRQVMREFHNPSQGKFAVLEDIKPLGDPRTGSNYQREFWDRVARALDMVGFLDLPPSISPERLQERIRMRMMEEGDCRLLLLLDEADNFLEADAERNFPVVSALKTLMDITDRRFKVVFAGLHNVQRFQRIPNQPLAHLGAPIEIGPLEPEAARELLERPLRALGYRFGEDPQNEDTSILLHILSYTNYHPGLIQLFGREMVDRLRASRRPGLPPFGITRTDVEAVYRNPDVRQAVRDRFNWTLALDERYEVITLAMILDQWEARDGFDRLYTPREIQEMASGWWPAGFEGMDRDRLQGYLDEMCGLGVLTYVEEGRYRLRSPNIVQLMGTYDDLWGRLDDISKKPSPSRLKLESHHARLSATRGVYSPLSYAQESVLLGSRARVGMVFGSEALQIRHLKEASSPELAQPWEEIRIPTRSGEAVARWLSSQLGRSRTQALRIFFWDLETAWWTPSELEKLVRDVKRFSSNKSTVRVIFVLGPVTAWQWFQLPRDRREELEQAIGAVIAIRPWDWIGIQQRLELHGSGWMAPEPICRRVHEVTGGWPFLMDEFFRKLDESFRKYRTDNPIPALEEFEKELAQPDNPVRKRFLELLQIPSGAPAKLVRALWQEQKDHRGEEEWVPRDTVQLLLEEESPEQVDSAIDYLIRMSVLRQQEKPARAKREMEREVSLNPVVYRLWGG